MFLFWTFAFPSLSYVWLTVATFYFILNISLVVSLINYSLSSIFHFHASFLFDSQLSNTFISIHTSRNKNILVWVVNFFLVHSNYILWILFWGNWFICLNCSSIFNTWLGYYEFYPLFVLTTQTIKRNRSVLKMTFLWWIFYKFWNILCGYWRNTTKSVTLMLRWFTYIFIIWEISGYMSTLYIFFTVNIFCWWMK